MTSPRARPVLLALLGILAIAVAAATLNSAVPVDGGGFGTGDGFDSGRDAPGGQNGSSQSPLSPNWSAAGPASGLPCFPILTDSRFLLSTGIVVVLAGALLYRWKGPYVPFFAAAVLTLPVGLLYAIFTACEAAGRDGLAPRAGLANDSSSILPAGNGAGGASGALSAPSLLLLGMLGVVLLAAVALLFVTSDDQLLSESDEEEPESEPRPATEAIGRAAGRAADRIEEEADLDNEVFRAWHEMTSYLDVPNPESSSPGEFAEAAVDAGMDREDVSRLTRLFEEVRYGAAPVTDERERRAVDALRRIESQYAEDEP